MKIMGIDPGTLVVGYGVIIEKNGKASIETYGAIKPPAQQELSQRLLYIYQKLIEILQIYKPDVVAIEKIFCGKNMQTAIRTGEGRGVALLAAASAQIPIYEYDATTVKKSIVGSGQADKKQVQYMVKTILNLEKLPTPLDASDALAIALCHHHQPKYE
ncbi:MAG: crossover junction endodeoxyribonuclease RuvC [Planctomycetes bacterium]|nr:crossover junction endodeoxyribonuclease RuvC [Planctomycetota bacterium]HON45519.1 crossover junction endodeoxyribonuclease RuvC [Planctomycetota bacterium]HPY75589.1 crossover junction endodeoxyribonuclease RuvC [Planctomycetota bacterium]HQB01202.1 crossover junction endodeoxyribonuclease RuvC [Planctomycetota bacterium]HRU51932.1 crossover junction endodeoxyribonuclease RuvC [Planctomycetota bacterium]